MKELEKLRKKIDKADEKLLKILAERFSLTKKIGEFKKRHNLKIRDLKREKEILKTKKELARKLGLDPKLIEKIFKLIFKKVLQNHKNLNEAKKT